jgi:hypothetical protein
MYCWRYAANDHLRQAQDWQRQHKFRHPRGSAMHDQMGHYSQTLRRNYVTTYSDT